MDKCLILNYEPFIYKQNILLYDGDLKKSVASPEEDRIPIEIVALCNSLNIFKVKLAGPLAFTSHIKENIGNIEVLQYGKSKIEVEQY